MFGFFRRHHRDQDFRDEVETHLSLLIERYIQHGMSPAQARDAAHRQFGNTTLLQETRNEMQSFVWFETLLQDLRYGIRVLAKNAGFTTVAVLTLALGIGANTSIFSVVNAAILRSLPLRQPEDLTVLWGNVKRVKVERRGASYPDFRDWRAQNHSFTELAAFGNLRATLNTGETPERIDVEYVSQSYFPLLGIDIPLGRNFRPEEDSVPQRDAVVILTEGAWRRRFGADRAVIGRTIRVNNRAHTVVGVAPVGFRGLTDQAEMFFPFMLVDSAEGFAERGNRGFQALGRLKPGVTRAAAQSEMDEISRRLAAQYPGTNESRAVEVASLIDELSGQFRRPLLVLLVAVGFVLLIACTNVANLMLARSEARQREMAMRAALGASRLRVLRQLLVESALLVGTGAIAGLVFAHYAARWLVSASPVQFPSYVQPSLDGTVTIFTLAVCGAVALILGLVPAAQLWRTNVDDALKQGSTRAAGTRRGMRFRDALVVVEMAFSLVLLVGAGLMMRTLGELTALHPGYNPSHVLTVRVSMPRLEPTASGNKPQPDARIAVTSAALLTRISALPSVQSAALGTDAPLLGGNAVFYMAEGQPPANAQNRPRAYFHRVTPDFFRTIEARFVAGRAFTPAETASNADVAVVTENMVRRFWPGQNPIGRRIRVGGADSDRPWLEIVGVVADMKYRDLPENPTADPDLFQVLTERARDFALLVRTPLEPASLLPTVRAAIREADASTIVHSGFTLEEMFARATAQPRFTAWLMTVFAGVALMLAALGIYGVVSYSVSRRTQEIGLRMALGAGRPAVLRLVAGHGMWLILLGLMGGTAAAIPLARLLRALLYGVTSTDTVTYAIAVGLLTVVAVIASLLPAMRASRIDPAIALRGE